MYYIAIKGKQKNIHPGHKAGRTEESNMKKFSIEYHETYGKTYEIEANSPE